MSRPKRDCPFLLLGWLARWVLIYLVLPTTVVVLFCWWAACVLPFCAAILRTILGL